MPATPPVGAVLVAIPVLNEVERIGAVLDQLRLDLPQDRAVRFLVLDGGSRDGTQAEVRRAALRDPRVELVHNPGRLQSAAVNLAASLALPEEIFLLRCDAHTAYPAGFVGAAVDALVVRQADSVVVPMDSAGTTAFGKATAWVSDTPLGSGGSAHRGGRTSGFVDHGHHAGWTIACFRAVGGYDESYSHNEDAELDCRIVGMGMRIWLESDIRLTYFVRPTPTALAHQYRNYGRGRSRTARRHSGSIRLRQMAVPSAMVTLALAAGGGLLIDPLLLALPAIYLAALMVVSIHVALRHRAFCGLLAGLAAFLMHAAWTWGFLVGLITIRERRWHFPGGLPVIPASYPAE
jgi:succinoglycan biosynthesis protein ExoA